MDNQRSWSTSSGEGESQDLNLAQNDAGTTKKRSVAPWTTKESSGGETDSKPILAEPLVPLEYSSIGKILIAMIVVL